MRLKRGLKSSKIEKKKESRFRWVNFYSPCGGKKKKKIPARLEKKYLFSWFKTLENRKKINVIAVTMAQIHINDPENLTL